MNKLAIIIGIILIGLSFYSIGPVLCDGLLQNACGGRDHYLVVLPYFLVMLGAGLVLLVMGKKSISLLSFNKAKKNFSVICFGANQVMRNYAIVFSLIGIASLAGFLTVHTASAECSLINEDWPEYPCHDVASITLEEKKQDWVSYYELKGKKWMEEKRKELIMAILNGSVEEWKEKTPDSSHWNVYMYYSLFDNLESYKNSPLKQFGIGISSEKTVCREGLELVVKHDSTPACVKPETKHKLIERGWAKNKITKAQFHDTEYSIDEQGKVDLSKIDLPKTDKGRIDYTRLGYLVSETQFKKMLAESEIEYEPDNFTLITGMQLDSEPPYTDYCGYVEANDMEDYWFSGAYHNDTLTGYGLHYDNPNPCKPNTGSCLCSLQTKLAESTITEFSYFDKEQQSYIAEILIEYVSENRNLTPKFLIGQYNMDYEEDVMAFCGEFWGHNTFDYFLGWIQNGSVVGFGIEKQLPKLCAISDDAQYFGKVLGEE